MAENKKVLYMNFETIEGGTFKIALNNTLDELTAEDVKQAMDTIVDASVFKTIKGDVVKKVEAYYITQEVEELDISQ